MDFSRELNINILCSSDFYPDKYVRELSQTHVGGLELQSFRNKIKLLSEDTNKNLKKNVYQNYVQFIDTAKEISHLESEMYQLSHLLSEQKSLLTALSSTSILGDESHLNKEKQNDEDEPNEEEENAQKISSILEKVDGCQDTLANSNRTFLFEGDLLELDALDNTVLKTVHVYLFNDGFMITNRNTNSKALKYIFEVFYELRSLAVVNVRDLRNVNNAFKLLIFPDTRIFQCTSNTNKKEWLEKFDQAKKARLIQEQHKKEPTSLEKSPSRSISIDSASLNPFDESEDDFTSNLHPEWILDISEELDVCVAQRHFDDALFMIQKAKEYIAKFSSANQLDITIIEIQKNLEVKQNQLTEVLMKELEINPDKSLQGGLRAARRAVRLLNHLGRCTQACDLFLKLCSSMLKIQCKRVKREGSTAMYVRNLSSVVFTNICHMTEEFLRAFPDSTSCSSAYVVWASSELSTFTTHFIKQVFMPQTSLATLTECVGLVKQQCERLCSFGVDLCYQLDVALKVPLIKALKDMKDKLIDSVKVRSLEDKWIPSNFRSKSGLARCLHEHREMGLKLDSYITGDVWLQLTPNTISFTKVFLALLECCLRLKTTEILYTIDIVLCDIFEAQIKHIEQSLKQETQQNQKQFKSKNAEFLLNNLLELVQKKYKKINGYECNLLNKMKIDYSHLITTPYVIKSTKKYSSEFL